MQDLKRFGDRYVPRRVVTAGQGGAQDKQIPMKCPIMGIYCHIYIRSHPPRPHTLGPKVRYPRNFTLSFHWQEIQSEIYDMIPRRKMAQLRQPMALLLTVVLVTFSRLICIDAFISGGRRDIHQHSVLQQSLSPQKNDKGTENVDNIQNSESKQKLLNLLAQVPPNESTSKELTQQILQIVNDIEDLCPTPDTDVLSRVSGKELVWTAQDKSSLPNSVGSNPFVTFINPREYNWV